MLRNSKDLFAATRRANAQQREAHARQQEAALRQVQGQMDEAWEDVDKGWERLQARLAEIGVVKLESGEGDIACLNVGGVLGTVPRSILAGRAFGDVLGVAWKDDRVPRSSEGFIFLDESPVCVKHLIRVAMEKVGEKRARVPLPVDENSRLDYVSRSLGLVPRSSVPEVLLGRRVSIDNSTMVNRREFGQFMMTLVYENWCRGEVHGIELIYSSSRDGMNAEAFHTLCGDTPSTLTLVKHQFRTQCGSGLSGVVGGYTTACWSSGFTNGPSCQYKSSADAFVFSLRDETSIYSVSGIPPLRHVKYNVKKGCANKAIVCGSGLGPSFGMDDLKVTFSTSTNTPSALTTGNETFDVPASANFLEQTGTPVQGIEVFRVHIAGAKKGNPPSPSDSSATAIDSTLRFSADMSEEQTGYGRKFGVSIAESLMEEQGELENARAELTRSEEKASAARAALEAIYGPDIASGKKDEVVELSVRGTGVTTLRSTLTACPDSALATLFSPTWPPADKDLDDNGRRIVDCDPAVFSKVLDVLRMKKRAGWRKSDAQTCVTPVPVVVREADRACFDEFVHKYFPGCESFVMDLVKAEGTDGRNA